MGSGWGSKGRGYAPSGATDALAVGQEMERTRGAFEHDSASCGELKTAAGLAPQTVTARQTPRLGASHAARTRSRPAPLAARSLTALSADGRDAL